MSRIRFSRPNGIIESEERGGESMHYGLQSISGGWHGIHYKVELFAAIIIRNRSWTATLCFDSKLKSREIYEDSSR